MTESTEIPIQNEMDAQTYLEQNYPTSADKVNHQYLNLGTKNKLNINGLEIKLTGSLDLTGFTNLKMLWCNCQKITQLNLSDCLQLEYLYCWENELTELDLGSCLQLKCLGCYTNKLANLGLSNCEKLEFLYCWENRLTQLDLRKNKKLTEIYCHENNLTSLEIKSHSLTILGCWGNQLSSLDLVSCPQLTTLWCDNNQLTSLNLNKCLNLNKFRCFRNQLSILDLTNCPQLTKIHCSNNQLTQLTFPPQLPNLEKLICPDNLLTDLEWEALNREKLTVLNLRNNNFIPQELGILGGFTNLKELNLENTNQLKICQGIYNRWIGSLRPLQSMKLLRALSIENTDLERGTKYLPVSVMEFWCSYSLRIDSRVKSIDKEIVQNSDFMLASSLDKIYLKKRLNSEILSQIKDFNHQNLTLEQENLLVKLITSELWINKYKRDGLCVNCQQLNGWYGWCQPCNLPHLQVNFANWTSGNAEIDKLIQKCQLEAKNGDNILEWIPYEQFANIEFLDEGGFSKIYKARWISGTIKGWNNKENKLERWKSGNVVLKILTDSQNMTTEFFQEVINYKLISKDERSHIAECYGISQETETGNYVMVMKYIEGGNLRQFLQSNYKQLNFSDRLGQLLDIIQGLCSVHEMNLVHQDFHAGNVLSRIRNDNLIDSVITDLGLSRPIQETNKEQIYGVLPYVAPEVLLKKKYAPKSDIYSFSMIAYELFSNQPPFAEYAYDSLLVLRICQGLRPNLRKVIAPRLLKDLISCCWDADPKQRPTAGELYSILRNWLGKDFSIEKNTEFYHQYQELLTTKVLDSLTNKPPLNYPTEKYTSQLLDFPNLPQPQNSKELNEQFYNSQDVDVDVSKKFVNLEEKTISQEVDLIDNFADLNIQTDPQEESSLQTQIEIPPKQK